MSEFEMYMDALINWDIASLEEIRLVCMINGWKNESLTDILYARTGYRDFDQYSKETGWQL